MKRSAIHANLNSKQIDNGIYQKPKVSSKITKTSGLFDKRRASESGNLKVIASKEAPKFDFSKRESLQFGTKSPLSIPKPKSRVRFEAAVRPTEKTDKKRVAGSHTAGRPSSLLAVLWGQGFDAHLLGGAAGKLAFKPMWNASALIARPSVSPKSNHFGRSILLLPNQPASSLKKGARSILQRSKSLTSLPPWTPCVSEAVLRPLSPKIVSSPKSMSKCAVNLQKKPTTSTVGVPKPSLPRRKRTSSLEVPKPKKPRTKELQVQPNPYQTAAESTQAAVGSAPIKPVDPSSPKGKDRRWAYEEMGADEPSPSEDRNSLAHASGSQLGLGEMKKKHKVLTKYTDFSEGSEDIHKTREKRVPWAVDESGNDGRGLDSTPQGNFLLSVQDYKSFEGDDFYKITPEEEQKMQALGLQRDTRGVYKQVIRPEVIRLPFTGSQEKWS